MTAQKLPPEVLLDIIDALVLSAPSHSDRIPALAALARTNRRFHNLANPSLYRNLFLDTPRRFKILSTLASNPTLGKEVRSLTVSGGELSVGEFDFMKEVLADCPNVSRFTYLCFDPWYLPALTAFVGKTWSHQLRYLRSDQKDGLFELLCRLPNLEELVASRIDFPISLAGPLSSPPLASATDLGTQLSHSLGPGSLRPLPSFRLERFDSGSSPFARDFDLLTRSSRNSLVELDLPISSQSPLQDLSDFTSLSRLTLTLAERYIPHNLDSRIVVPPGGRGGATPPRGDRDDVECLRRVRDVLAMLDPARLRGPVDDGDDDVERPHRPRTLERLELYQPDYRRTRAIASCDVEESQVFEGIPSCVKELDLSTLHLDADLLLSVFGTRASEEGQRKTLCGGLQTIWLAKTARSEQVERVLSRRGIEVTWV